MSSNKLINLRGNLIGQYSPVNSAVLLDIQSLDMLKNYIINGTGNIWQIITGANSGSMVSLRAYPFDTRRLRSIGEAINGKDLKCGEAYVQVGSTSSTRVKCNNYQSHMSLFYMGDILISPRYFAEMSYLDYGGFTKIEAYLPYYGYVSLAPEDCMNKVLTFFLHVDIFSGMGTYLIYVSDKSLEINPTLIDGERYAILVDDNLGYLNEKGRFLSSYDFQLGIDIPLGRSNATDVSRNQIWGGIGTMLDIATIGLTSPISGLTIKEKSGRIIEGKKRRLTKDTRLKTVYRKTDTGQIEGSLSISNPRNKAISALSSIASASQSYLTQCARTQSTASVSPTSKLVCENSIHIIIKRAQPNTYFPDYAHEFGLPLGEVRKLSTLKGYTQISEVHLEGSGFGAASDDEKANILELLFDGVILPDIKINEGE